MSLSLFKHRFNKTSLVLSVCVGIVAGVFLSKLLNFDWVLIPFGVLLAGVIPKRSFVSVLVCIYLGIVSGLLRADTLERQRILLAQLFGRKVTVLAVAKEDGSYDSRRRISFNANVIEVISPVASKVSVPVRVNTFVSSGISSGDLIIIKAKLTPGFGNSVANLGFADVDVIGKSDSFINKIRNGFNAQIRNALPEPQASFAVGLLIGQKTGLSDELQEILKLAGLTHIIAVSGYNLTIIVRMIKRILHNFSRFQILVASYALIMIFVGVTGMSPSIMRALIVSTIMLLAWYLGRSPKPIILLMLSVSISALIEPLQLFKSVGWYLSFSAFTGVILIAPLFVAKLKKPALWKNILIESLCAGIMTMPIIALVFKQVSITGVLANSIVVPVVPIAMLSSTLSGIAQWINPVLGALISYPTKYLLKFILDAAGIIADLPGTSVNINPPVYFIVGFYVCVLGVTLALHYKRPAVNVLQ